MKDQRNSLRWRLIIGLLLLTLSAILAVFAHFTPYFPGDVRAMQFVQSLNSPFLTSFMTIVSQGFTGLPAVVLVIACVVIVWWRLGKLEAIFMVVTGVLSPIANLLKLFIRQPRPPASLAEIVVEVGGLGFPSGHAFFAAMILGIVVYFVLKYASSPPLKVSLVSGLTFIILLVGYSRVYLGDHWVSEVIESYIIAGGLLLLLTIPYERRKATQAPSQKVNRV
ncbi:MAG TPA: phosphatase PAP2 family protein [Anaerolineales bacterium]|nr:phosphatase PAP2 family protein [Anaerolineales bacterium]